MQLFVFVPKPDGSFPNPGDAALRDGRPPHIATGVLQEMPFVLKRLNLDAPPAFLQMIEQVSRLAGNEFSGLYLSPIRPNGLQGGTLDS